MNDFMHGITKKRLNTVDTLNEMAQIRNKRNIEMHIELNENHLYKKAKSGQQPIQGVIVGLIRIVLMFYIVRQYCNKRKSQPLTSGEDK